MILHLFPLIFWSIITTLVITPISIRLAMHFRLIDHPNSSPHKIHRHPIPKASGLAIGLVIVSLNLLSGNGGASTIRAILLSGIVIFIFGLWDDARKLSPQWKLVGQILATVILISQGIYIRMLGSLMIPNIILTFLWVIGITNAFNLG